MCLTIPKQVVAVKGEVIKVRSGKGEQEVATLIRVKKGDWVLTQNNVIIQKVKEKDAREVLEQMKVLSQPGGVI